MMMGGSQGGHMPPGRYHGNIPGMGMYKGPSGGGGGGGGSFPEGG